MKKFVLQASLLCLVLPWVSCNKKNADNSATKAPATSTATSENSQLAVPATQPVEGELVMTAELAEISGPFPANDLYNYSYVMKYKVIKIIKGAYADADILVGHYNPRIARAEIKDDQDSKVGGNVKSFQVGDIHYLVLSPMDAVWTGAVEDDYFKEKRARYWAFWADKLK
jgi:hypothetical protein